MSSKRKEEEKKQESKPKPKSKNALSKNNLNGWIYKFYLFNKIFDIIN